MGIHSAMVGLIIAGSPIIACTSNCMLLPGHATAHQYAHQAVQRAMGSCLASYAGTSMAVCRRGVHSMSSMRVPYTPWMLCCLTKRFTLLMPLAMSRGMLLSTCTAQTDKHVRNGAPGPADGEICAPS